MERIFVYPKLFENRMEVTRALIDDGIKNMMGYSLDQLFAFVIVEHADGSRASWRYTTTPTELELPENYDVAIGIRVHSRDPEIELEMEIFADLNADPIEFYILNESHTKGYRLLEREDLD